MAVQFDESGFDRLLGIDTAGINRQTGSLAGKTHVGLIKLEIGAADVEKVFGVRAIDDACKPQLAAEEERLVPKPQKADGISRATRSVVR